MFKLKLKVLEPAPVLERRLKEVIVHKVNDAGKTAVKNLRKRIGPIIEDAVRNSPEVKSLQGGQLQAEFGATDTEVNATIDFIVRRLAETIVVEFKAMQVFGGKLRGTLTLSVLPRDLIYELSEYAAAKFTTKKGTELPWMKWLLTLGDKIIIKNYVVDYDRGKGSRTGLASMRKVRRQGWRVPPQFSGTINQNFITRSLDNVANFIEFHLQNEFLRAL